PDLAAGAVARHPLRDRRWVVPTFGRGRVLQRDRQLPALVGELDPARADLALDRHDWIVGVVVAAVPGKGGRVEALDALWLHELGVGAAVIGEREAVGLDPARRRLADRAHLRLLVALVSHLLGHQRRPRGTGLLGIRLGVDGL